jgi:hypothetical protein
MPVLFGTITYAIAQHVSATYLKIFSTSLQQIWAGQIGGGFCRDFRQKIKIDRNRLIRVLFQGIGIYGAQFF